MKDLKIHFGGENATILDLEGHVEGKALYHQKALVNVATDKGSDFVYPERGTSLIQSLIGGVVINANSVIHSGNFAAIDTLFFISEQEYAVNATSGDTIANIVMKPSYTDDSTAFVNYNIEFTHTDGTVIGTELNL